MGRILRGALVLAAAGALVGGLAMAMPGVARADVHVMHPNHYKYVCPMGHEESDKPGNCSVCGMKLKKVQVDD